jgi:hypothetical protein
MEAGCNEGAGPTSPVQKTFGVGGDLTSSDGSDVGFWCETLVMTVRGPVWWSSRYAAWGWWVVVHCRANSDGLSSPWAEWGLLAL